MSQGRVFMNGTCSALNLSQIVANEMLAGKSWPTGLKLFVSQTPTTWSHGTDECFEVQATATTCLQNEKKKKNSVEKKKKKA